MVRGCLELGMGWHTVALCVSVIKMICTELLPGISRKAGDQMQEEYPLQCLSWFSVHKNSAQEDFPRRYLTMSPFVVTGVVVCVKNFLCMREFGHKTKCFL